MLIRIGRRATDESGIALIVVVLAMVVVSVLGVSLTISATRDLETSTSVQRASSSLAVAEAGVQH
ncbi:MAG: PilX N-terminal domain-containing pilus assembly protein, partial [Actinomycetota bacterium]